MICPQCKCEYVRGVTQCSDCGVPLVDALDPALTAPQPGDEIVSIWQGDEPADRAAVEEALRKAGIRVLSQGPTGYFIFPSTRPKTEICVSSENAEAARKIVADMEAWNDPEEMTDAERSSLEIPESDLPDNDDAETTFSNDLSLEWYEDDPVTEVWNGEPEDFADGLMACLREIGIASRKLSEENHWRVVVRPKQESRAKEVVREVVEASPPE